MKQFEVIHHQRCIRLYIKDKPLDVKFDTKAWERLIKELNNPPDIGVEVSDGVKLKEEISGS